MKLIVALCAATLALALPAAASTVVNGSFEDGVPGNAPGFYNNQLFGDLPDNGGGWDVYGGLTGWTSPVTGIEVQTKRTLGLAPQAGKYYLELDTYANSSITQSVALAVGNYLLSFWYAPRTGNPETDGIQYTLGRLASGSVDSAVDDPVNGWSHIVAAFTVTTAGSFALTFTADGNSDGYGGLIDNVSIDAQPSQVPVPAAGLLLLGALGGLAGMRRRKA